MNERPASGFLDRTLRNLRAAWRELAGAARDAVGAEFRPSLPGEDAARLSQQMRDCLKALGGEVTARARAAALGRVYLDLNETGRQRFLRLLTDEFDTDQAAVDHAVEALRKARDPRSRRAAELRLRQLLEPPRTRLLRQFNDLPDGVKFLVDLRADLLALAKEDPGFAATASDLEELLTLWFDIGFLELERITWESPAALLEKLIGYEAVHAIESWDDLKNRLDSDRRCFAFFHPRMPEEPLIFVEVALVNGMAGNIQTLLDESAPVEDPQTADTAIFYSISNAQKGLAGISFGGFLIKRVIDRLAAEFGRLKNFATLSPIPGFRRWLDQQSPSPLEAGLRAQLDRPDWDRDAATATALREPLMRLCARYLVAEKGPGGQALDRVAHFHLSNGARVQRLNWLADRSEKGMAQSAGLMINYLYRLDHIEANHEAYTGRGRVAASSSIKSLLKG
ncbi:MAG: malonyl-CoA decarboxylase [Kiloniellales bacterium]